MALVATYPEYPDMPKEGAILLDPLVQLLQHPMGMKILQAVLQDQAKDTLKSHMQEQGQGLLLNEPNSHDPIPIPGSPRVVQRNRMSDTPGETMDDTFNIPIKPQGSDHLVRLLQQLLGDVSGSSRL